MNETLLVGYPDYMVATGFEKPKNPYFFIQEYKKTLGDKHPKNPLLASMLVAMSLNQQSEMHGAYVIGRDWYFVLLQKNNDNTYTYFSSPDFSIAKIHELRKIYTNLQYIKSFFA